MSETLGTIIGIAFVVALVFGTLLLSQEQKLRCISMVKDKSATEIMAVCK